MSYFDTTVITLVNVARDVVPVTPSDTVDLPAVAFKVRATGAGNLRITTVVGTQRTLAVAAGEEVLVGVTRVWATSTTATGILAYVN